MRVEIINENLTFEVYGFSGIAVNKDYAGIAFKLMDRMWKLVKSKDVKNKGQNIWVYEEGEQVFAGVELSRKSVPNAGLEQKTISLDKYAKFKHVGSYSLIKQVGQNMNEELRRKGLEMIFPYIEIYGHWSHDETKLETELIMNLK